MHSAWFSSSFLRVLKFLLIKEREPNFSKELILKKVWIIWSALLYFKFKSFMDSESWSFVRYQWILHDSGIRFSDSWNLYNINREGLISRKNQLCKKSELLVPPFNIWILEVLRTQIFRHSVDFKTFYMIQKYFSQSLEISAN